MEKINFVGLHAHCGVGSPFDGFGYPQEHMDFAYENGSEALALTDHGNMNGFAYQVLHAKRMKKQGKNFKPIFGVEAYFIESIDDWREKLEEYKADKVKSKQIDNARSGTTVENEAESKSATKHDINRKRHLVLVAMNQTGLNNIFKLVSTSYSGDYFYRKPRIDFELLKEHNEGIIAMSACLGGVYAGCYWENREQGEEAVLQCMREMTCKMLNIFGDRWYGELQWNGIQEQHELNKYVIKMHEEFGIPLVSTCDSHYPNPTAWQDRELYKRIGWLGKGAPEWLDNNIPDHIDEMEYELYPKNGNQMWEDYIKYSKQCGVEYNDELILQSLEETHTIAFDRIEDFIPDNTVRLPDFVVPAGHTADNYLSQLAFEGLLGILQRRGIKDAEGVLELYNNRLSHELSVISDRGFSRYFLTMKAIVDKTDEVQLAGPGRGSAAGSLVAYALGITQVDPIKYGLLFSRFLRADATDYPDIDFDVSDPMTLKEKLIDEWGSNTVVPISNFNTLQLRSLIKDISKFYDIPFSEVNKVTGVMMREATGPAKKRRGMKAGMYTPNFEEVCEFSPTLQAFFRQYPRVQSHVEGLMGQIRSTSRHAGGVVIGEQLDTYMPLIASKGVRQTPWSEGQNVRQLEPMGFIKFDILGLATLRMMEECIRRILERHHGVESPTFADIKEYYDQNLHPDVIDLDDQEVYENIFHEGKWTGIFQFAEKGAQKFATRVKPRSIVDISAITSIFRPGPLSAGVHNDYVEAVRDPLSIRYENEIMEEFTKETHGFLIFQEQIALLAHHLGKDLNLDDANLLRKLLTKKGLDPAKEAKKEEIYSKFVEGCVEKGMTEDMADELWQKFEYFSGYGFNKSHAVSYSIVSYQCAWLATHYNPEWCCAFLDREPETRKQKAINLVKAQGYNVKPLNINTSGRHWDILDDSTLIAPLTTIKGLGDAAIDEIIEKRPFASAEDLLFDKGVVARKLNKKSLDALCRSNAMKDLIDERFSGSRHFWSAVVVDKPKTRKKLAENIEKYLPEGDFTKNEFIEHITALTGIYPLDLVVPEDLLAKFERKGLPPISEYLESDEDFCWCIPIAVNSKKTKNKKWYHVVTVIDSNSVQLQIRCWNIGADWKDQPDVNVPYFLKPRYDENWGFSTNGRIDESWARLA